MFTPCGVVAVLMFSVKRVPLLKGAGAAHCRPVAVPAMRSYVSMTA